MSAVRKEVKRRKRASMVPYDQDQHVQSVDSHESDVVTNEMERIIGELMSQLPDSEFRVMGLRFMGADMKRTALEEGWNQQRTVRIVARARERLRIWCNALELEVAR
jgi:hypothetical protein